MTLLNVEEIPTEGIERLEKLVQVASSLLGPSLRAIYGMGSLGYGGFVSEWSDFDIDIILFDQNKQQSYYADIAEKIQNELLNRGYDRIDVKCYSVEQINSSSIKYSHGLKNRSLMLLDSALLIWGSEIKREIVRPTMEELNEESLQILNWLKKRPLKWWLSRPLDDTAAYLALPARLFYTFHNEQIIDKKSALEYFLSNYSERFERKLWLWVSWALSVRYTSVTKGIPTDLLVEGQRSSMELIEWAHEQLEQLVNQKKKASEEIC